MEKNFDFKTYKLIIALIISLGIFFGGFNIYQNYMIEQPLIKKIKLIKDVEKVKVTNNDNV
ncbi:MAG: hypothetical protein ACOX6E_09600, partial [Syntrophomonadaceae bacterium]